MAQTSVLKAEVRDRVGKGAARAVRRQDKVPAVIYGDKKPPVMISLPQRETTRRLHAGGFLTHLVEIEVDGEKIRAIPKDYQLDPVRDFLIHVDFLRVGEGARLTIDVPVHFKNHARVARPEARRRAEHRPPRHRDGGAGRRHPRIRRGRPDRPRDRQFRPHLGDRAAGGRDADDHERDFTVATIAGAAVGAAGGRGRRRDAAAEGAEGAEGDGGRRRRGRGQGRRARRSRRATPRPRATPAARAKARARKSDRLA